MAKAPKTAFKKGQSGNPGGRPKMFSEVRALAQEHCPAAIKKLVALMDSADERVVHAACKELLDRGIGKPAQAVTGEGGEGPVILRWMDSES